MILPLVYLKLKRKKKKVSSNAQQFANLTDLSFYFMNSSHLYELNLSSFLSSFLLIIIVFLDNKIGSKGAKLLSFALLNNSTLLKLDLSGFFFTF